MAIQYTGDSATTVSTGAAGEFWVVESGDEILAAAGGGITINHTEVTLVVEGHVASDAANGVWAPSGGSFIYVTSTGLIESDASPFTGIFAASDENMILNEGKISGYYGVYFSGSVNSITNTGKVKGDDLDGINLSGGGNHNVLNSGTVNGLISGINSSSADNNVVNSGKVIGGDYGVLIAGEGNDLINSGSITAKNTSDAVYGSGSVQDVYNTGTIEGNVVLLGGGDSYDGRSGGVVTGKVFGGDGNDILRGGNKNDKLYGEANNDTLDGRAGNDKLDGGDGLDLITGGKGNDKLWGGSNSDDFIFKGKTGDDVIKDWQDGLDQIDLSAYAIANTTKFINKAISSDNGDAYIDLAFAGGDGVIKVDDAAGDIDFFDFIFIIV